MPDFNLGDLHSWERVRCSQLLSFDAPPDTGARLVRFDVMSDQHIAVHVVTGGECFVVGSGHGRISCRFTLEGDFAIDIDGPEDAVVMIRYGKELQLIPQDDTPSYANIAPRIPRVGDDLRRMMLMVKLNADRREAQLRNEMAALAASVSAAQAPRAPAAETPSESAEGTGASAE